MLHAPAADHTLCCKPASSVASVSSSVGERGVERPAESLLLLPFSRDSSKKHASSPVHASRRDSSREQLHRFGLARELRGAKGRAANPVARAAPREAPALTSLQQVGALPGFVRTPEATEKSSYPAGAPKMLKILLIFMMFPCQSIQWSHLFTE
ncbi:UNVERIFIED_CONTAM: hypothetical protein K2H54_038194 [Gekko kuhli]